MKAPHPVRTAANLLRGKLTYVHAGVTHRCNLKCSMCGIYKRAGQLEEATPARWREIAKVLADRGATTVSLGGGEPFLRTDLAEVIAAFADNGFRVRALTNGVAVTETRLRECVAAGLADLSFSLDSLRPEVQRNFDGLDGGLEKRIANLAMISRVLPPRVVVLINTVISASNLDDLEGISDLAYRLGHLVSFIPVHLADEPDNDFFGRDEAMRFPAQQAARVRTLIAGLLTDKARRRHVANSREFLREIPQFLIEDRTSWICTAGRTYLSLRPDGRASICHHYETLDAIEVEQIDREWTPESLRRDIAACPGCLRPCWAEVALLATDAGAMWDQAVVQLRPRPARPVVDEAEVRRLVGLG
jgi:MoaA/NifB/PqqE/SkfB family radical SAM enzyme